MDDAGDAHHVLHRLAAEALADDLALMSLQAHAAAVDRQNSEAQLEIDLSTPGLAMTFMRSRASIVR